MNNPNLKPEHEKSLARTQEMIDRNNTRPEQVSIEDMSFAEVQAEIFKKTSTEALINGLKDLGLHQSAERMTSQQHKIQKSIRYFKTIKPYAGDGAAKLIDEVLIELEK